MEKSRNKNIQEKFNQLKAPMDKEAFWEELQKRDEFPKSKPFNFGKLILGALFLVIIGAGLVWNFYGESIQGNKADLSENQEEKVDLGFDNQVVSGGEEVLGLESVTDQPRLEKRLNRRDETLKSTVLKSENLEKGTKGNVDLNASDVDKKDKTNDELLKTSPSKTKPSSKQNHLKANQKSVKTPVGKNGKAGKKMETKNSKKAKNPIAKMDSQLSEFENEMNVQSLNDPNAAPPIVLSNDENRKDESDEIKLFENLKSISKLDNLPIAQVFPLTTESSLLTIPFSLENQIQPKKFPKWALTIQAGMGRSFNHFSADTGSETNLDFRKKYTHVQPSYLVSADLSRTIKNYWAVFAELQYSNQVQSFEYEQIIETYSRNDSSASGFYTKNTTTNTYQYFHRYRFFDTRIGVEKRWNFGGVAATIRTGLGWNLSLSAKGKLLDDSEAEITLKENYDYVKSTNLLFFGEARLLKPIFKNAAVVFTLGYQPRQQLIKNTADYAHGMSAIYGKIGVVKGF